MHAAVRDSASWPEAPERARADYSAGTPGKRRRRSARHAPAGSEPAIHERGLAGTVRIFNADKGWGFILGDTVGGDIFLHSKHMLGNPPRFYIGHKSNTKDKEKAARLPEHSVRVTFDLSTSGDGKPQALNVRIVSGLDSMSDPGSGDGVHLADWPQTQPLHDEQRGGVRRAGGAPGSLVSEAEAREIGLDERGNSKPSWLRGAALPGGAASAPGPCHCAAGCCAGWCSGASYGSASYGLGTYGTFGAGIGYGGVPVGAPPTDGTTWPAVTDGQTVGFAIA